MIRRLCIHESHRLNPVRFQGHQGPGLRSDCSNCKQRGVHEIDGVEFGLFGPHYR